MSIIRFCLVLHNHQPIGNFEGVIEQAYRDSYLPFLDVFESYAGLKFSLHFLCSCVYLENLRRAEVLLTLHFLCSCVYLENLRRAEVLLT